LSKSENAGGRDQGSGNRGQGSGNREQGSGNREQGYGIRDLIERDGYQLFENSAAEAALRSGDDDALEFAQRYAIMAVREGR
jgi:hypothetical protein